MLAHTACARNAQPYTLRQSRTLCRDQRSIRRYNRDDRTHAALARYGRLWDRHLRMWNGLANRHAVDLQSFAPPVVGLDEYAHRVATGRCRNHARGCAGAALEIVADHASAPAYVAFGHRPTRRVLYCLRNMLRLHVQSVDITEQAIVGLGHHRQSPEDILSIMMGYGITHQRIAYHAHAMRIGERNRRHEHPRLPHPLQSGHLAVAVEPMTAREQRLLPDIAVMGHDHRYASVDGTVAGPFLVDECGKADAHPWHVSYGIIGTRR